MTPRDSSAAKPTAPSAYSATTLRIIAACFILSGATGLIYEILWARMLGLVFGATTLAVSTVLAAFMGGLALGSALAGRLAGRVARPVRAYGLLEIGIALYALAVPLLFSVVDNLYAIIWQYFHPSFFVFSSLRFLLSCVMLLVPTTLMGATLPLLSSALTRSANANTSVTRLYTRNLVGAICGSLAAGFLLLPILGVRATIYAASFINIVIGIVAIFADRPGQPKLASAESPAEAVELPSVETETHVTADEPDAKRFWLFCAFVSGFVTISTQVAWTRILSMIIGSSTYAFSIVVALFLLGLSAGAFLIARRGRGRLRATMVKVELLTAVSLILSLAVVNRIPEILIQTGLRLNIESWVGLLALQVLSVGLLVLLPAFLMGTVMPLVLVWTGSHSEQESVKLVGRSYAVNTIGAIAGAFAAGFVLIPRVSTRFTIIVAAASCVVVAAVAYQPAKEAGDRDLKRGLAAGAAAVLIVLMFIFAPRMNLADLSIGAFDSLMRVIAKSRGENTEEASRRPGPAVHKLLMYEEGPTSTVSVRQDWDIISMAINGRTNASDKEDMPTQVMLGQLPLLVAPNTRNALVVGYATGVTAGSMLQSSLENLECVELEPATIRGSKLFEHVNNKPLNDPRMRLIIDDARTYLRVTPKRFDIIVSEPSHPWVPGVANLFTEEFFQLGRDRLADEGVFVQWLQIYQLSTDSLRSVLATFHRVFPHVSVYRVEGATKGKDLLLVGSRSPLPFERLMERTRERMGHQLVSAELARVNIRSEADVRSWYVCDEVKLGPAVAGAVINTDDNMHIETTVPREAFRPLMQTNATWIESLAK
ncbi:MAG TPA: fused MFS/spermidine synthase [Pyrinomonadaceae bacterium]|nr:fused MFS/spermidine synthase [Pyrinomonadaceae bacterium]